MTVGTMDAVKKAWACINEEEAISFIQSLIQINSINPPGRELDMAKAIQSKLEQAGLQAEIDEIAENRANILVSLPGETSEKVLTYSGHLDTVPLGTQQWDYAPLGGEQVGNRIYGRGVSDMKGGVAAMLVALECLHRANIKLQGKLQFAGTAGEEVDCFGAKEVVRKGQIDDTTAMVISEPSSNEVFCAHKGNLQCKITIHGKAAHGSMPQNGINAILVASDVIQELKTLQMEYEAHPLLGSPTVNVGTIQGGVKPNIVPDECIMEVDIRTVPGQNHQHIVMQISDFLQKASAVYGATSTIDILNDLPAVTTEVSHPFTELAVSTLHTYFDQQKKAGGVMYYTDASVFAPHLNVPILIYGPGEPSVAHQKNEWMEVDKYLESIRYYIAFAIEYLQVK